MPAPSSHTFPLTAAQADSLERRLRDGTFALHDVPYARVGARKPGLSVTLYEKGPKVVVQGKECTDFISFVLEPEILGEARLGYEETLDPAQFEPHFGIDESGKGDFFGPLVIAGVYTDAPIARALMAAGVTDSKRISSDARIRQLAGAILQCPGVLAEVVVIPPEKYNALYEKIGNVNRLLAWGHARTLENLLEKAPDCPRAISDQFGAKELVQRALLEKGRKLKLEQMHKAEADVAVAAASILARAEFISRMDKLGAMAGVTLPRGASAAVVAAAVQVAKKSGFEGLARVAKLHFKTTETVLSRAGIPNPMPWRGDTGGGGEA
jgi:ribonuclease HIII